MDKPNPEMIDAIFNAVINDGDTIVINKADQPWVVIMPYGEYIELLTDAGGR